MKTTAFKQLAAMMFAVIGLVAGAWAQVEKPVITYDQVPDRSSVGRSYNGYLYASGSNIGWSLTGNVPSGLGIVGSDCNPWGECYANIGGGPLTQAGSYTFTVNATNSAGSDTKQFTVVIKEADEPYIILHNFFPDGEAGAPYGNEYWNAAFLGYNCRGVDEWYSPCSFSFTGKPAWLYSRSNLDSLWIYGTPTQPGKYTFTVTATSSTNKSDSRQCTIEIKSLQKPEITWTNSSLSGVEGTYDSWEIADASGYNITWGVATGSLPPGLAFEPYQDMGYSYAYLRGTPTQTGTFTFKARATNSAGSDTTNNITVVIAAPEPPVITTTELRIGDVGGDYWDEIYADGSNIEWSIVSGILPPGLDYWTGNGQGYSYFYIRGSPSAAGSYTFKVRARNSLGFVEQEFTIAIKTLQPPIITTTSLSVGGTDAYYSARIYAKSYYNDGVEADAYVTWEHVSGTLPPGLDFYSYSWDGYASIYGDPSTPGVYPITIRATNNAGYSDVQLSIDIKEFQPPVITTTGLRIGEIGAIYDDATIYARGNGIDWSISSGTLPPGLQFYSWPGDNYAYIYGTPTVIGEYPITVRAESDYGVDEKSFTIEIIELQQPVITTTYMYSGEVGRHYSESIRADGSNIEWRVVGGNLPLGLELEHGGEWQGYSYAYIRGYPEVAVSSTFTVEARNDAGHDTKTLTIDVQPLTSTPPAPSIEYSNVYESAVVGGGFDGYIEAYTNGYKVNWSVVSGTLPPGLQIDPVGGGSGWYAYTRITGTPTTAGEYTFKVRVSNAGGSDSTEQITIRVIAPPVITTTALPSGEVGVSYSASVSATGTNISWYYYGTLPYGLTFNESNGAVSGTPTQTGTFSFWVEAANEAGWVSKQITIEIEALKPPVITATTLPNGAREVSYSVKIASTGSNVNWTLESGTLPAGLSLIASTGTISGTPTGTGTSTFTVKIQNDAGSDTKTLSIVVIESYTITFNAGEGGTVSPTSGLTGGSGTVSLPTPSRTGYSFSGWFTAASGGAAITSSYPFTANTTIYAQWTINTYTVTFNSQSGSAVSSQSITYGNKATEPSAPTRAGYTFGGWFTTSATTTAWNFANDAVTSNVTIYAKWTKDPVSVLESDRVVPTKPAEEATVIAPVSQLSGEFTAGPNPVARQSGEVKFYRQGKHISASELRIYDINGNAINKVKISDNKTVGSQSRRQVGKWDLCDRNGRIVSEGTYLVKGVVKTSDGKSEKVSVILSVK